MIFLFNSCLDTMRLLVKVKQKRDEEKKFQIPKKKCSELKVKGKLLIALQASW